MVVETKIRVSVVIPVFNAKKFISETIESVVAQTYPHWELVVVDDGSTDGTSEILKKYKKMLSTKMRIITQKNCGVSIARNRGIAISKGEYIAFLDHDDLWLPEKLEIQTKILDSDKSLGMVYCDSYVIDEKSNIKEDSVIQSILSRNIPLQRRFRGWIFDELFYVNYISLETAVIRKKVLKNTGMFNPDYKIAEDYDLFLKIAKKYPVDFVEKRLAKFRAHAGGASRNIKLRVAEEFKIMQYWLDKEPNLRERLKYVIKLKKLNLHGSLIKHYFENLNFIEMTKEIIKMLKNIS